MAVVCPHDHFRLRILIEDPLDVVGHAFIARHLVGAQLHRLQHDARVLDGPLNIDVRRATRSIPGTA